MPDFFKSRTFITAMVLTVLLGVYAAVSASGQRGTFLTKLAGMAAAPFQSAISWAGEGIGDIGQHFEDIKTLQEENEALKAARLEQEKNLMDFERYQEENIRLKALLGLKESSADSYETEVARVIAKETRDFSTIFILNKGSLAGISVNDAVIAGGALLGYVSEVGPNFSKVATLFEVEAAVGAICVRTSDSGVIEGSLAFQIDGYCKMSYIPKETTMVAGDYIETSGYGGIYPPGLLIGRIEEIALESHGLSQYAKIKPAADLKSPKEVLVVVSFLGEEELFP